MSLPSSNKSVCVKQLCIVAMLIMSCSTAASADQLERFIKREQQCRYNLDAAGSAINESPERYFADAHRQRRCVSRQLRMQRASIGKTLKSAKTAAKVVASKIGRAALKVAKLALFLGEALSYSAQQAFEFFRKGASDLELRLDELEQDAALIDSKEDKKAVNREGKALFKTAKNQLKKLKSFEKQVKAKLHNADKIVWGGEWNTNFGTIKFRTEGRNTVVGRYSWNGGGALRGKANGQVLGGSYDGIVDKGRFVISLGTDGNSFSGEFTSTTGEVGTWNATRATPR